MSKRGKFSTDLIYRKEKERGKSTSCKEALERVVGPSRGEYCKVVRKEGKKDSGYDR